MGDSGSQVLGFGARLARARLELDDRRRDAGQHRAAAARARDPDPGHDARDACAGPSSAGRSPRAAATTPPTGSSTTASPSSRRSRALTLLAALLGATALAYDVLANARVTAVGVLISFVVLVQFASFLGDLQERSRREDPGPSPPLWRAFLSNPRRLVEVLRDFAIICVSFLTAYLLFIGGKGDEVQRAIFLEHAAGGARRAVRRVRRLRDLPSRSGASRRPRDLVAIAAAVVVSAPVTVAIVAIQRPFTGFPLEIFVVNALLCTVLVAASRLVLRIAPDLLASRRGPRERTLIVGAGRSGRRLARELRETSGNRVVGFLDDNPSVRRRRVLGVKVLGGLDEIEGLLAVARPDQVLVTIPDVPADRLNAVVSACAAAGVPCRLVRSRTEISQPSLVEISAE